MLIMMYKEAAGGRDKEKAKKVGGNLFSTLRPAVIFNNALTRSRRHYERAHQQGDD